MSVGPARMVENVYLHQAQMEAAQVQEQVDLDQVGQDLVVTMITHVSVLMGTLAIDVKQVCILSQFTLIAVLYSKGLFPRLQYPVYPFSLTLCSHHIPIGYIQVQQKGLIEW